MRTFVPLDVPPDVGPSRTFLQRLQQAIRAAANRAEPYITLEAMKAAPDKALIGIFFGTGAPTFSAGKGSLYLRSDGSSTSTRAYINTDGATTWAAVTTAA
jgi:hypothetical protein